MASRRSGPLRAFRIADMRHTIFDGTGAMLHGARWNSPGRRVIYAAETYAGALLEILVHASGIQPMNQAYVEIAIPEGLAYRTDRSIRCAALGLDLLLARKALRRRLV